MKMSAAPTNGSLPFPSLAPRQAVVDPCRCPHWSIGAAIRVDGTVTDEAPRAEEETGCSAVTGDPHNRMEHK